MGPLVKWDMSHFLGSWTCSLSSHIKLRHLDPLFSHGDTLGRSILPLCVSISPSFVPCCVTRPYCLNYETRETFSSWFEHPITSEISSRRQSICCICPRITLSCAPRSLCRWLFPALPLLSAEDVRSQLVMNCLRFHLFEGYFSFILNFGG